MNSASTALEAITLTITNDYLREKYVQAKADFRELLKETKLITYK
jgi:hypothetical protein